MTNVLDWILDLFRDPVQAQAFINDPDKTMQNAGVQNVSAAQVNAVAASVAPAAIIQGGGNPVHGLQQAVAQTHGIAFAPQHVFAPETQAFSNNDTLSHNDVLSNNDPHILSPEAGHDVQQGGVNLDFGDITFGDKNTASDGSVINTGNAGDIDNTNVHGDGNVVGDGNVGANTGDILAGEGSTVQAGGVGNTSDSHGSVTNTGGGDVISGNEGPVVKTGDIDTSGGNAAGGAGGHGGILGGGGDGGAANAGGGGAVVISPTQTTTTNTGGGDVTSVDTHGGNVGGNVDASHHDDNSVHTDNSTHDSHNDSSVHTDNSTHDSHDATVDTHVDVSNDVGLF
jgi:hypothetical protein